MSDVTRILTAIQQGNQSAAEQILPLVYEELWNLAGQKMAHEKPGHTLQATALVHEAYLRLVDGAHACCWDSRRHFFAAAAEAMRRILIEEYRRKKSLRHGGGFVRVEFEDPADEPDLADLTGSLFDLLDCGTAECACYFVIPPIRIAPLP